MRALEFLGDVPAALVPDQLKSGVTRACRCEPEAQRTYEELARHYGTTVLPARPKLAERRVLQPVGMALEILVVQQLQRHPDAMALAMAPHPVGVGTLRRRDHCGVQTTFELGVVERLDGLPLQASVDRATRRQSNDARADAERLGNRTMRPPKQPFWRRMSRASRMGPVTRGAVRHQNFVRYAWRLAIGPRAG